ncbi:MAG TPA: gluconate 2-dehydrogenase subunit 3 family protein [Bryobacteraceae bacterium]|nr:gluconate 2-dehydrogenase subunit 3 family protein [Bryobacteraceae bacterium]
MNGASTGRKSLPIDPNTHEPLPPVRQPGYYPGYSTLAQQTFWDAKTRSVILHRVNHTPPIRFFDSEQAALMKAVCDRIIPQDDRDPAYRIPIVNYIDERLHEDKIDGFRYENMPADRDVYRLGLQAIDMLAQDRGGLRFVNLDARRQDEVLKSIHDGNAPAAQEIWNHMSIQRFWKGLVSDCASAYYSHPWAWDEIGFGGPAYPRGYMRLEGGEPEPWEVDEVRYEWQTPPDSLSDVYEPAGGDSEQKGHPGQGGTH